MDCPFCDEGLCHNAEPTDSLDAADDYVCDFGGDCSVCQGSGHIRLGILLDAVSSMSDPEREEFFENLRARWYMKTGAPRRNLLTPS
jgi:hypothetical protein